MAFGLATVTGDRQILRTLRHLEKRGAKRAMTAGINASMTVLSRAMRAAVTATDVHPNIKREARRSVGKRFKRGGTNRMGVTTAEVAKVGFKVAKPKAAQGKKTQGTSRGKGVSVRNIHWFVLGTVERRHDTTGRPTGKIQGVFGNVTAQVMASSSGPALAAARKKTGQVILREAAKRR